MTGDPNRYPDGELRFEGRSEPGWVGEPVEKRRLEESLSATDQRWSATDDGYQDGQRIALVDLLDRLLTGGVVLNGEVIISLAGVDLVHVSLRALISSAAKLLDSP